MCTLLDGRREASDRRGSGMTDSLRPEVVDVPSSRLPSMKLQVIGGGQMGEALVAGLIAADTYAAEEIRVVEQLPTRRAVLHERYAGLVVSEIPGSADCTVIATKPGQVVAAVQSAVANHGGTILSIAAGIRLSALSDAAGEGHPVIRIMPNTPALVGMGASAYAPNAAANEADAALAERILGSVGVAVCVEEAQLDAVTGVSGSGPAYVMLIAESMIDAAVAEGLARPLAETLVIQTIAGAGRLMAAGRGTPAELRAQVTSPGGTTAAGLGVLEQRAMRGAMMEAIHAATLRSRELG